jgi:hypothetical protein
MLADHEVGKALQRVELVVGGMDLEIAEAHERRRDTAYDRAGLGGRVAVVEHVADHRFARGDEAQRARGRDAEPVHRLAA